MAISSEATDPSIAYDGWTVLVCRRDGGIGGTPGEGSSTGLYEHDARVVSRHDLRLDGEPVGPLAEPFEDGRRWSVTLHRAREGGDAAGPTLPQDAWEIDIERTVGPGMLERLTVRNHAMVAVTGELTLDLDADFADSLIRGGSGGPTFERSIDREGEWVAVRGVARHAERVDQRGVRVRIVEGSEAAIALGQDDAAVRFTWALALPPRGTWLATLAFEVLTDGAWHGPDARPQRAELWAKWEQDRTRVEGDPVVGPAFERAATDLLSLRNWDLEPSRDGHAWIPNAGVPWFAGLFGRDVLTAGWQASMLGPEIACGALEATARTQGRREDAWTEEEPGRIIHELRRGPLATLRLRPQAAYYGNQTAPSFFPVALTEAWHWTGDDDLLRRHRDTAWRTIEWARRFGDRDGDGFLEYRSTSNQGLRNQGWKDSDEAVRWPDGSLVDVPIATIEEQAFHYLALQRMAEILVALDEPADEADRLLREAEELRARIDAAYWLPEDRYYAMALDPRKRAVATIASNPLHALAAGVIPSEKAALVAERLLGEELFSGWGIRTLSSAHPSFNPFAYHLGSVWPVENATALIGFRRYGLDGHLDRLTEGFFASIRASSDARVPELFAGHSRSLGSRPLPYPGGNPIQAWSASAVVEAVQAMLGIYPFAPAGVLTVVRPRLPRWLPAVTVRNLRVGGATVSLRFERQRDGSARHEVIEQSGHLLVVGAPPPNAADHADPYEWLADAALRRMPGRLGRALRIGVGLERAPVARS